ncbi:DUF421 domain-containing protein [Antribacter sp. KLBMP9083]|uniref:DUF421 domain-containing protein n=1 Tax=Antribacter soli TaxID=2910976 RepID=A0AA41QDG1_9MICO|nr:YetF domain-containing protein [Antribacter soli]MCF4121413.1 DUF421 domain-containing protein [Antribacter soli]
MWNDLLDMGVTAPDKILRTVAVYLGLALLLRLVGKRDLAQLNTLDLVVMLLLSNVVQNAVIGPDNSLVGGLLGAVVLLGMNAVVDRLVLRSDRLARLLEGSPAVLARNGAWDDAALRKVGLRRADADAALRRQNANGIDEVETLSVEPGGTIVATLKPGEQSATVDDVARLEAKLDALLARY